MNKLIIALLLLSFGGEYSFAFCKPKDINSMCRTELSIKSSYVETIDKYKFTSVPLKSGRFKN